MKKLYLKVIIAGLFLVNVSCSAMDYTLARISQLSEQLSNNDEDGAVRQHLTAAITQALNLPQAGNPEIAVQLLDAINQIPLSLDQKAQFAESLQQQLDQSLQGTDSWKRYAPELAAKLIIAQMPLRESDMFGDLYLIKIVVKGQLEKKESDRAQELWTEALNTGLQVVSQSLNSTVGTKVATKTLNALESLGDSLKEYIEQFPENENKMNDLLMESFDKATKALPGTLQADVNTTMTLESIRKTQKEFNKIRKSRLAVDDNRSIYEQIKDALATLKERIVSAAKATGQAFSNAGTAIKEKVKGWAGFTQQAQDKQEERASQSESLSAGWAQEEPTENISGMDQQPTRHGKDIRNSTRTDPMEHSTMPNRTASRTSRTPADQSPKRRQQEGRAADQPTQGTEHSNTLQQTNSQAYLELVDRKYAKY